MNEVKLTGIIKEGRFYNNGGTIEVVALLNRNGYNYKIKFTDNTLFQKVLALGDEVAINGKLRINNGEVIILVNDIQDAQ